ncbi:MAG: hypothetical protein U0805_08000 [Pirellulales bacterium]
MNRSNKPEFIPRYIEHCDGLRTCDDYKVGMRKVDSHFSKGLPLGVSCDSIPTLKRPCRIRVSLAKFR